MDNLGENLREYREKAGLTQSELARKCFVSSQMICFIEAGSKQPSLALALGLAKTLGITVEELAG